jgi:hypothetical protein
MATEEESKISASVQESDSQNAFEEERRILLNRYVGDNDLTGRHSKWTPAFPRSDWLSSKCTRYYR